MAVAEIAYSEATDVDNATDLRVLFLGLDGFVVLSAMEHDGELVVLVETTADRDWCRACGVRAVSKGRVRTELRDLPSGGRPVRLVWKKRIWRCEQAACEAGSWRETADAILPRASLTERARIQACRRVGQAGHTVAEVARDFGVGWGAVMRAVVDHGTPLVDDLARLDGVRAVGLDESSFLKAGRWAPTRFVTSFVDIERGRLLDVIENRTAAAVSAWFSQRSLGWKAGIEVAAIDPYQGYATALRRALPGAQVVVDHFHAVRLANQVVDEVRRRTQQETTGHRGRKGDPLYGIRHLLLIARERLDDRGRQRIAEALGGGDRYDEVACAWTAKELLRDVYAAADVFTAAARLEAFLAWARDVDVPEVERLARTTKQWRTKILAYHTTRRSNGPTEAMNLLIKKIKRVGHGFRNLDNYRLRLLLHCGVVWNTAPTAKIRGRTPLLGGVEPVINRFRRRRDRAGTDTASLTP